jgi:hypothetical protein
MLIRLTDAAYVNAGLVTSVTAIKDGSTWIATVVCAGVTIAVERVSTYEEATAGVAAIVAAIQGSGDTP